MAQDRYTLNYRAAEVQQVLEWVKSGQSGCLIGLRGAGKSNFLRFLLHQAVRQHYLGPDTADFSFVHVDLLALSEPAEWAVYELILNHLLNHLQRSGPAEHAQELGTLQLEVIQTRDILIAQRAFERGVELIYHRPAQRLVFLFDEFGTIFGRLGPALFRHLRAVRDAHKDQLCYIVVVANDLADLRNDLAEVEHFYRLVSRNVCGLGPYNEADTRQMIRFLAVQHAISLNEEAETVLTNLSGGHAGLLKDILSLLRNVLPENNEAVKPARVLEKLTPSLLEAQVVQDECRKVWASLSQNEQAALPVLLAGQPVDPPTLQRLKRKGLVRQGISEILFFSPVFANFVRQQRPSARQGVIISRSPRLVQLEGRQIKGLSSSEFELLTYLYDHRDRICTKDELIQNIYPQEHHRTEGDMDDGRLQKLISRLRQKIGAGSEQPSYIVTVRGEGYRFVEPGET